MTAAPVVDDAYCTFDNTCTVDGFREEAVCCHVIRGGLESCRVGFLPRALLPIRDQYIGKFALVLELYKDSESQQKRRYSHIMNGMASCVMFIP